MEKATLWLVVNPASGSNDDETRSAVETALSDHGYAPARVIDITEHGALSPAALDAAGVTHLAIFTGDGSLSSVLGDVEGWSGSVLVLPGGTTNLLAKALHGVDITTDAAIDGFAQGRMTAVQRSAISWHGGKAVCELLAGPGATWSDVREEMRDGNIIGMAQTALGAVRESAGEGGVILHDPDIGNPAGYGGVRLVPEDGGMVVDGYGADTLTEYLKQGLALLKRDFREGPHDELGSHPAVVCRSADGSPIELMIDGERETGSAEERFTLAPLRLNLLSLRP